MSEKRRNPNPKGNPESLTNLRDRSEEERKAIASKGGKAKAEKDRIEQEHQQKLSEISEIVKNVLNSDIPEEQKKKLRSLGIKDESLSHSGNLIVNIMLSILNSETPLTDKIKGTNYLLTLGGINPLMTMSESAMTSIEDDEFSKSIDDLIKGAGI